MQRLQLPEHLDQRVELVPPDSRSDIQLRPLPIRRRRTQRGPARFRDCGLARPRVVTPDDVDETTLDERIEIARQRGSIEQQPFRELRDPQRPVARERAQE